MAESDRRAGKRIHQIARMLRRNATFAERKLWRSIHSGQLNGFQFRRQFPIGHFIVDFCCRARRLMVELGGSQHASLNGMAEDRERMRVISERGYDVIRFWNEDILTNLDAVLERFIVELNQPQPILPLVRGEE